MKLTINKMSCGGCVRSITQAIVSIDDTATVQADLPGHSITVNTERSEAEIRAALDSIGYPAA